MAPSPEDGNRPGPQTIYRLGSARRPVSAPLGRPTSAASSARRARITPRQPEPVSSAPPFEAHGVPFAWQAGRSGQRVGELLEEVSASRQQAANKLRVALISAGHVSQHPASAGSRSRPRSAAACAQRKPDSDESYMESYAHICEIRNQANAWISETCPSGGASWFRRKEPWVLNRRKAREEAKENARVMRKLKSGGTPHFHDWLRQEHSEDQVCKGPSMKPDPQKTVDAKFLMGGLYQMHRDVSLTPYEMHPSSAHPSDISTPPLFASRICSPASTPSASCRPSMRCSEEDMQLNGTIPSKVAVA